jgi:hypothetical protein
MFYFLIYSMPTERFLITKMKLILTLWNADVNVSVVVPKPPRIFYLSMQTFLSCNRVRRKSAGARSSIGLIFVSENINQSLT